MPTLVAFSRLALVAGVLLLVAAGPVLSAVPPLSPELLEKQSTVIATGKVIGLYRQPDDRGDNPLARTSVLVEIEVTAIEKGDRDRIGSPLYVRCWEYTHPNAKRPPGPQPQHIPSVGDRVKVWAAGAGPQVYQSLYPNGIDRTPAGGR